MTSHPDPDRFILFAAGELNPAEQEPIRAHLAAGCPICAGQLAEAEATLALLGQRTPPVAPPADLFAKIEASLAGQRKTPDAKTSRQRGRLLLTHLATGAIAATIAAAIVWTIDSPTRELMSSKDLQLVRLSGSDKLPNARGHVLWDETHHRWQVTVFELAPPPPGRTYELWFITADQQKHRAAVFNTRANGQATLSLNVPPEIGPIAMAAVTDEPAGGSAQPTGSILLVGKVPG